MDRSECPTCGTPYVWKRKFNNGNPKDFLLPDCNCETPEERRADEVVDRILRARERRHRDS